MGSVLDVIEEMFYTISNHGSLMMNEDYKMDMVSLIAVNVDPFAEYLEVMFTPKHSKPVAECKSDNENELNYFIRPKLIYEAIRQSFFLFWRSSCHDIFHHVSWHFKGNFSISFK